MKIKLSDYVWSYVENLGVRHVFMFPGGGAMHLVDSLGRNSNLQYITLMHEQACTMAAETYARIDYNLGVVLVTTGPGGTNTITGVAAAWLESTPVIMISGQVKTKDLKEGYGIRQHGNQEIGIIDIVASITKYAVLVTDPMSIRYHLEKAVYEATTGRQGPVWLDIPLDVQATIIETNELKRFERPLEQHNRNFQMQIEKTVELIKKSKRPIIIVGQGLERGNGKDIFRKLVERLKIPVLTSWIAVEVLDFDNPYNMGKAGMVAPRYSNYALQNSDLVIAIGTRLDSSMIGYDPKNFAPNAQKIIVDIDKNELNKFEFEIESKIIADATDFVQALLKKIESENINLDVRDWVGDCTDYKHKYPILLEEFKKDGESVNPYYFVDLLSDLLAEDDVIIPGSSGAGIDVFWLSIRNKKNQRMLATGSLGSMGYGIPACIGACLASGKRTICVEGDGSFQLNIQELGSIIGMNLPIKIFVFNNGGYLSIMNMQRTHFEGHLVGANSQSHLYLPNIAEIAKAYNFTVFEIQKNQEVMNVCRKALDTPGPVLCNIIMNNELTIQPKVMSRVQSDGTIKSGGLEDLWPFLT